MSSVIDDATCEARQQAGLPPLGCTDPHIDVRGLAVCRGQRNLFSGLNLQIARGKFVGVVGPSGVGKSSLLYCLAGMLRPESGSIQFRCAGGCEHLPSGYQRRIGFIHQDLRLVPTSTLLQNVLCGRLAYHRWWRTAFGFPRSERKAAFELLKTLGLGAQAHKLALECSGGEQQRAAVARAIVQDPEIYLADEPVSHLDFANARNVLNVLKREVTARQKTVFCTLHDEHLVREYADLTLRLVPGDRAEWVLEEPVR